MKDKILYLIVGMLLGAIITAGGFVIFGKKNTNNENNIKMDFRNFEPGDRPSFEEETEGNRPAMPDDKDFSNFNGQRENEDKQNKNSNDSNEISKEKQNEKVDSESQSS